MTITLKRYISEAFPIEACWKLGSIEYSSVYESREAAISHLTGRFGYITVIDMVND